MGYVMKVSKHLFYKEAMVTSLIVFFSLLGSVTLVGSVTAASDNDSKTIQNNIQSINDSVKIVSVE